MRLFILAAGTGTRLLPLTKETPKVLLDLGEGKTLLDTQIKNAIISKNIIDIVIITGFHTAKIKEEIKKFVGEIPIQVIHNPFYKVSNNLMSLWVARDLMQAGDFIVTNGDNMYNVDTYDHVVQQTKNKGVHITIDYKDEYDDDDMKVSFHDGLVSRVHKDIDLSETEAESVGLSIVRGREARTLFIDQIVALSEDESYINKFWLEIFNSLIAKEIKMETCEIHHQSWKEVDFHPDVEAMKKFILGQL